MAKFRFSRSLLLLTFFDNLKFWTPLFCKNVSNFCQFRIPPFQKTSKFPFNLIPFSQKLSWFCIPNIDTYSITKVMLVESRERLNYLVHAMHWIHIPMLTPYIVFLLKNAAWFSTKVFPKCTLILFLFYTWKDEKNFKIVDIFNPPKYVCPDSRGLKFIYSQNATKFCEIFTLLD